MRMMKNAIAPLGLKSSNSWFDSLFPMLHLVFIVLVNGAILGFLNEKVKRYACPNMKKAHTFLKYAL
jgi:hypothetical protein